MDSGGVNALLRARALLGREERALAADLPARAGAAGARPGRRRRALHALRHARRRRGGARAPRLTPRRLSCGADARGAPPRRPRRDASPPSGWPATSRARRSRATATTGCSSSSCRTCCGSSTSSRSTTATAASSCDPRSRQPEAHAGRVRREVRARAARLRRARVAGGRGRRRAASTSSRSAAAGSARTSPIRVWSPADAEPGRPLRLLLANDGPEYDALSSLTRFSAAKIAAGELPPHRVALLAPGDRNQWYSASAAYARVLAHDIVPGAARRRSA